MTIQINMCHWLVFIEFFINKTMNPNTDIVGT